MLILLDKLISVAGRSLVLVKFLSVAGSSYIILQSYLQSVCFDNVCCQECIHLICQLNPISIEVLFVAFIFDFFFDMK